MNVRKIVKFFIPKELFKKIEPWGHLTEAVFFNLINGFPARGLKVIGITGTNGKTTTAFLTHRMLHEAGYKVGLMTTVGYGVGDNIVMPPDHYTNVPVPLMMKRIKELKKQGAEWLVMEVTSMALAQHRVWGVPFYAAAMTNISQDHLDYHGTMEKYIEAKIQLFKLTNRNKKGLRVGVVNADDPTGKRFAAAVVNPITYGLKKGDIKAKDVEMTAHEASFQAVVEGEKIVVMSHLPGKFNIYNTLAAIGIGRALGLSSLEMQMGIAALTGVPGRMTTVEAGQKFNVLVDFAHTPDALQNVLEAARELTKGQVILVFGATGDRDKGKRAKMGEVASGHADRVFLTDDETYTEDPARIIEDVYKGIKAAKGKPKTSIMPDRWHAIKEAFAIAKPGDTVLLAGIGHQTSRNMGGKEEPWNEIEIARELLA